MTKVLLGNVSYAGSASPKEHPVLPFLVWFPFGYHFWFGFHFERETVTTKVLLWSQHGCGACDARKRSIYDPVNSASQNSVDASLLHKTGGAVKEV